MAPRPMKSIRCVTPGCTRTHAPGFKTCCRTCNASLGRQHGRKCQEVFRLTGNTGPPTEHRAITVAQLRDVVQEIEERCVAEHWTDIHNEALAPAEVSLYDLNFYVLLPKTVPNGVRLKGWNPPPSTLLPKAKVTQSGSFGVRCRAEGLVMEVVDAHTVVMNVLVGQFASGDAVEFAVGGESYAGAELYADPLVHSSYVGLLSPVAQRPNFFVSHWWGEPVMDFVTCVGHHAQVRGLPDTTAYWVCAYANDQHDLASEVTADPSASSFCRALMDRQCSGVLLVLNAPGRGSSKGAVPFTRVWCAFEIFMALSGQLSLLDQDQRIQRKQLLLDIATADDQGPRLLTDGLTAAEQLQEQAVVGRGQRLKMEREASFPLELIRVALQIQLEHAEASVELDRRHILNLLACAEDLSAQPPEQHENFDAANARLRASFALATWCRACAEGLLEDLELPAVLSGDGSRRSLTLTPAACLRRESDLELLAASLPTGLHVLELDLSEAAVSDASLRAFTAQLPERTPVLRRFALRLRANDVGDEGLAPMLHCLPELPELQELKLVCRGLDDLSLGSFEALEALLLKCTTLQKLHVTCANCGAVSDKCLTALGAGLPHAAGLLELSLQCTGCEISDSGVVVLCRSLDPLRERLRRVRLSFVQTRASRPYWHVGMTGLKRLVA